MSDLHVCTPCVYTDKLAMEQSALLRESCDMNGIELHLFGKGRLWFNNWDAKLVMFEKHLREVEEPYVMMVDCDDSLIVRGEAAILEEYGRIPEVMLAGNKAPWPRTVETLTFPLRDHSYRYPNAGGMIGPTLEMWWVVSGILRNKDLVMNQSSDQEGWVRAYLRGECIIDVGCNIFQNMSSKGDEDVKVLDSGLLQNTVTWSNPCVVHFGGRTKGREELWDKIKESTLTSGQDSVPSDTPG